MINNFIALSPVKFWTIAIYFFSGFNFFITFPIFFHFLILPKIEKRIGKKLEYRSVLYKFQIFSQWVYPPIDIARGVVWRCFCWIFFKKVEGRFEYSNINSSPLVRVGYDVRQASKFEIVISFLSFLNFYGAILLLGLNIFIH